MRPFVVAANWKMHKSPREAVEFFKTILPELGSLPKGREVVFFVPAIDLWVTEQALRGSQIGWGAQNCHFELKGAFTGENSPAVLAEIGARYCLVGHSERRAIFGETDDMLARKVKTLQTLNISPMLCVGETLSERDQGKTDEVIVTQLKTGLKDADLSKPLTIAYEPVWAIGTGRVATPDQAQAAHVTLRKALASIAGEALASKTPILYGGSVKPDNAGELKAREGIDGFLVGGASLEVPSFLALVRA